VCQNPRGVAACLTLFLALLPLGSMGLSPVPLTPHGVCDGNLCHSESICRIVRGLQACVPISGPLPNGRSCLRPCDSNQACRLGFGGRPACIPISSPLPKGLFSSDACRETSCRKEAACKTVFGKPQCVPKSVPLPKGMFCKNRCRAGTLCRMTLEGPACVPVTDFIHNWYGRRSLCGKERCHSEYVCKMVRGKPRCVPICSPLPKGRSCKSSCSQDTVCKMARRGPACVPITDSLRRRMNSKANDTKLATSDGANVTSGFALRWLIQ
jgi:hypothetical protein